MYVAAFGNYCYIVFVIEVEACIVVFISTLQIKVNPSVCWVSLQVPLVFQSPCPPVEIGLLWVEMLRFYSLEFNMADSVISVRTAAVLSREMKDWPKKRIAVEGQRLYCL